MKRSSDNEWGNYSCARKIAYGKIPRFVIQSVHSRIRKCSRTRHHRAVLRYALRCFRVSCKCSLRAATKRKGLFFSSLLSRPLPAARPVLGHWFARNIIRKHRKQMSEPSDWNERRLNESKDRKYTILKRKRERKGDDERYEAAEEGRVWQWVVGGWWALEGWRLLNQQKPLGGWFSDASTTSATESFPSYLSYLLPPSHLKPPSRVLSFSPSFSPTLPARPSSVLCQPLASLTRFLLRYTLRFVLAGDYDTDKGKIRPREKNPPGSQNQKCRGASNELLRI